jgi:hypothetical protein
VLRSPDADGIGKNGGLRGDRAMTAFELHTHLKIPKKAKAILGWEITVFAFLAFFVYGKAKL